MKCTNCATNSGHYITSSCIGCMARFTLTLNKPLRLWQIENNGRFNVQDLKDEVIRVSKR
jgi:hypothetical protein